MFKRQANNNQNCGNGSCGVGMLIAFVAGAVAGGVATLLLAPKNGKETRAAVKETATKVKTKITDKASEVAKTAKEAFERTRNVDNNECCECDRNAECIFGSECLCDEEALEDSDDVQVEFKED